MQRSIGLISCQKANFTCLLLLLPYSWRIVSQGMPLVNVTTLSKWINNLNVIGFKLKWELNIHFKTGWYLCWNCFISVLERVSMCVRNLSERFLFSEGMSYSDDSIRVSKSTEMWKSLYFSLKLGIKWWKKECFSRYVSQRGVYFFNFGTTYIGCFSTGAYAYPRKVSAPHSPYPTWVFWLRCS